MTAVRFVVLGLCVLWAAGGLVVMLSYPADSANEYALSAAINFGPLIAAVVFFLVQWRLSK
jgi:hypothetical protein